jgi:D-alanyl-D-alanine carboxypeptidase (penicillin-binding protein 5/6)
MRRSGSSVSLIGAKLLATVFAAHAVPDPYPQAARSYLRVRDGTVLWARDVDQPLQPASLVKLLTALVVLDSNWNADRWLTVSAHAAAVPPAKIGLRAGEQITAGAALAAMLIRSANDACRTLAESVEPDPAAFAARMNERAARLGMLHSHFVDPCGFDAPGQHSTVQDLFVLAQATHAMPLLARLTATPEAQLTTRSGRIVKFASTNQLLGRLEGTVGMKTGYTSQAGQCLIAYVQRGGHEVWLIMLGGTQRWWLSHGMINDAFDAIAH